MSVNCFSKKGNASVINARETAPINSTETMYEKVHNSSKYGKITGKKYNFRLVSWYMIYNMNCY